MEWSPSAGELPLTSSSNAPSETPRRVISRTPPIWALPMSQWGMNTRIVFVLLLAASMIAASIYLRFRVYDFTRSLYPQYESSSWSPFVQAFKELSWFGYAAGLALAIVAVHRWLQGPTPDQVATRHD